jgi:hypothetical protein
MKTLINDLVSGNGMGSLIAAFNSAVCVQRRVYDLHLRCH